MDSAFWWDSHQDAQLVTEKTLSVARDTCHRTEANCHISHLVWVQRCTEMCAQFPGEVTSGREDR